MVSNRGCAFVEFSIDEEASLALKATQNSQIDGKTILVRFSEKDIAVRVRDDPS